METHAMFNLRSVGSSIISVPGLTSSPPATTLTPMSSLDVLLALRTAIRKQEAISYAKDGSPTSSLADATHITLSSGSTFAKSAPTRWRRQQDASATDTQLPMDPTLEPHRFFALDVIVLAWVARNDNGAIYMRQATTTVQNYVSLTERRSVVDWLEGKISDHERLAPPPGQLRRQFLTDRLVSP